MKLEEVRHWIHRVMLEWRAIDSLLETEKFENAYARADEAQCNRLPMILKSGRIDTLRRWIKDCLAGPLKFQSYRQLRELAKQANVPRWSRLTRDEILEALEGRCEKPGTMSKHC